jgi:hypothetical protein
MLTIMFFTLIYTSVLRHKDLKILQATAQRWMIRGYGGISYHIVFVPRSRKKNISVDEVWINNKSYKATVAGNATARPDSDYSENVLSIELTDSLAENSAEKKPEPLPQHVPAKKGDAVIVYTVNNKKRYHIISQLTQLPFLMAN